MSVYIIKVIGRVTHVIHVIDIKVIDTNYSTTATDLSKSRKIPKLVFKYKACGMSMTPCE